MNIVLKYFSELLCRKETGAHTDVCSSSSSSGLSPKWMLLFKGLKGLHTFLQKSHSENTAGFTFDKGIKVYSKNTWGKCYSFLLLLCRLPNQTVTLSSNLFYLCINTIGFQDVQREGTFESVKHAV